MTGSGRAWGWFAAWAAVGAAYLLALLTIPSIGLFVAPLPIAATVLLVTRRGAGRGLPGLLSGAGVPVLYVAYLNRSGPGTVCSTTHSGQSCVDQYNPWPWLACGLIAVVAGLVVFVTLEVRRHRSADAPAAPV
jgi:hypothetical protein